VCACVLFWAKDPEKSCYPYASIHPEIAFLALNEVKTCFLSRFTYVFFRMSISGEWRRGNTKLLIDTLFKNTTGKEEG